MSWCGNCLSATQQLRMTSSWIRFGTRKHKLHMWQRTYTHACWMWDKYGNNTASTPLATHTETHNLAPCGLYPMTVPIPWLSSPPLCTPEAFVTGRVTTLRHLHNRNTNMNIWTYDSWTVRQPYRQGRFVAYVLAVISQTHKYSEQPVEQTRPCTDTHTGHTHCSHRDGLATRQHPSVLS